FSLLVFHSSNSTILSPLTYKTNSTICAIKIGCYINVDVMNAIDYQNEALNFHSEVLRLDYLEQIQELNPKLLCYILNRSYSGRKVKKGQERGVRRLCSTLSEDRDTTVQTS
ncbi:hypothetical protein BgiBS90_008581, partial [Biomphalaria glabrata]